MMASTRLSSVPSSLANRPLKRRITAPDMSFFTPSSDTFKPLPYVPHPSNSIPHRKLSPPAATFRATEAQPPPPVDPSPDDPMALFIHPPFTSFPNAYLHPEGLSYNLMAVNPEWFLDPEDFINSTNNNPHAISYPSVLEPPRGWCPIKKKDSKGRNAEGWPEGEEPRLRCTFCRRTYAGVNAKSMWRRHVFEKHKIAMANRREGAERARGSRSSNKENKQAVPRTKSSQDHYKIKGEMSDYYPQDSGVTIGYSRVRQVYGQIQATATSATSDVPIRFRPKLRSLLPSTPTPDAPVVPQSEFPPSAVDSDTSQCADSSSHDLASPFTSPRYCSTTLPPSSPITSPVRKNLTITRSPYDPAQSPAFKYSPLRLPCDQPWRFPSPSHPLYSSPDELCLGFVSGIKGEGLQSMYIPHTSSPLVAPTRAGTDLISSPSKQTEASPLRKIITGRLLGVERKRSMSDSSLDLTLKGVPRPVPRRLFYSGPLPVPVTDRIEFDEPGFDVQTSSTNEDDVVASDSFLTLDLGDPFAAWLDLNGDLSMQKSASWPEVSKDDLFTESPVLRAANLHQTSPDRTPETATTSLHWQCQPSGVGLGISMGLEQADDEDGTLMYPSPTMSDLDEMVRDADQVEEELMYPPASQEELDESFSDAHISDDESFPFVRPPLKRRRTISVMM